MPISLFTIVSNISTIGWVVVVGSVFSALLGAVVYWQNTKKRSSFFFFLFSSFTVVWGLAYAFFEGSIGTSVSQIGLVALYLSASIVPVLLFMFLYTFSNEDKAIPVSVFASLLIPAFLIALILFIDSASVVSSGGVSSDKIIFGRGFWFYAAYIGSFFIAGFYVVLKKYRESAGMFKLAMRELLLSVATAYILAILMSLLSPLFVEGVHDLFWGGHISVALLVVASSFILAKYNFWNVRIIATELFLLVVVSILVVEIFLARSLFDLLIKTLITIFVISSSSFLDGSVKREIRSKDEITRLLFDLNIISRRLKTLDKKKSEFLSTTSRQLRDPLTVVRGYASMLLDGTFGNLSDPVRVALEKIFDSSGRLLAMISDFLSISNIESGTMQYDFKEVDLKKVVLEICDEMAPVARRAELAFECIIDEGISPGLSFVVVGDEGKLRQVISNLIDNSIKYTPRGEVSVLLSKSPDGKHVLFSIGDTGIGMSEATKEKIFNKFSRATGVNKVYTEGTGLGLYVAKEIIKKHEGRIWGESKGEGHGSSFYVELEASHSL